EDPEAAAGLVRTHVEQVLGDVAQQVVQHGRPFGSTLKSMLLGNPQRAENLAAAIMELPGGGNTWAGFQKLLDVLEASDRYLPSGSNRDTVNLLRERYLQWRLNPNARDIARVLTDPAAPDYFRELLRYPPTSTAAQQIAARLAILGNAT